MENQKNILIVDDEEGIRRLLTKILTQQGHRPVTCESVDAAIKLLEQSSFDLIMVDMIMPIKSGLDLVRHVKENKLSIPLVVMTGYSVLGMLEEAEQMGVKNCLFKPTGLIQVDEIIRNTLSI